uniref:Beta-xylanase (EC) n=1 Tax=Ganoderma boninense TaxID=34458 RepID=A0A5K1K3N8_9APHY|nr:Beta-xylanase (EC [Ganoderma boninense]
MLRNQLLQLAVPLVKQYGFSREALARSVLHLPKPHEQPLSEAAITSLFGSGDDARRTLINGWLDLARAEMRAASSASTPLRDVLASRLRANEPFVPLLPEAFALLATPSSGLPPFDPMPGLKHVSTIADDVCYLIGDTSVGPAWFRRRATIAAAYGAAELHQLTSPNTAYQFLDEILNLTNKVDTSVSEVELFGKYILRSWGGIIRSSGILP